MSRESVVFFGKGGIGKSTVASNFSALLGAAGGRVLHVGCDPKMDSTLALAGRHIPPFSGSPGPDAETRLRGFIQPGAVKGVSCVEAGGPQAGLGCAGAGIGALLETVKAAGILEKDGYTASVFDVLGDVVCGGFAAPLRRGFAKKVVIVTSAEALSLYSANRLVAMTQNFARNGVWLAGLAVNCRDDGGAELARAFAAAVGTRVLGILPRDPSVPEAERRRVPAALYAPASPFAAAMAGLCRAVLAATPGKPPKALSDADFGAFLAGRAPIAPPSAPAAVATRAGAAEAFRRARLRPVGLEGGQIVCDWSVAGGTRRIVIAPAGPAAAGRLQISDWAACIHPSSDESAAGSETIKDAVAGLAGLKFSELLEYFGGPADFHGRMGSLAAPGNFADSRNSSAGPRRPHMGAGLWQRFIFPRGADGLTLPPDLAVAEHGDGECRFCEASGGPLGFFSSREDSLPGLAKESPNVFSTGFGSREALSGEGGLVRRSLEAAARAAGPGGLVEFYSTCGPMLLAGDTASAAAEAEKEFGVKVRLENYNSYGEYSAAKAAARASLMAAGLARGRKKCGRPSFDLAFHGYSHLNESLSGALTAAGVKVSPAGTGFYEHLVSARLVVLQAPDAALCPALDKAGVKWLVPPAPFGFGGTKSWFKALFKALGRVVPPSARPRSAQVKQRLELAAQAGRFSAGFVTGSSEIEGLSEHIPCLRQMAEAGFGLRLLVHLEKPGGKAAAVKAAALLFGRLGAGSFKTAYFSTQEELEELLATPAAMRLVYSDIRRDPRVLAAGKTPFSARLFEPGYDGALESARRLLRLCDWDFSRRYLGGA
ncbi:MAG TPA: hypothetical protein DEQ38_05205 [Elusimicrobia bacterium]|nr:MAG: hypothetical protein A2089_01165 [Elusimicrobia bacterium GWD2_63_28]HCC47501.1 hypothetical protein [Elusimicrobiota bacterium]